MSESATLRIDKWMWYARFFKSRSQASRLAADGKVRVDGQIIDRAHHPVKIGNILTFPQARRIRAVRVLALSTRRGPATEAQTLYEDLISPETGLALEAEPAAEELAVEDETPPAPARRSKSVG